MKSKWSFYMKNFNKANQGFFFIKNKIRVKNRKKTGKLTRRERLHDLYIMG